MCLWTFRDLEGEAALTPAGHHCRSTGCLSSRSHSGPEQHRASTSSLPVPGSPGTLETAVNHLCSYSIDKTLQCTGFPDQLHAPNPGISLPNHRALARGINNNWASVSPITPTFQATLNAGLQLIDITLIMGCAKRGGAQASAEAPARTPHFLSTSLEDGT